MEKPAPFNLNESIRCWREQLARFQSFQKENLEELEAHVRDSVNRLQASGLSEEEAWLISQKRLGRIDALDQEFAKVSSRRCLFRITEYQFICGLLVLFSLAALALYFTDSPAEVGFGLTGIRQEAEFVEEFGFLLPSLHEFLTACLAIVTFLAGFLFGLSFRKRNRQRVAASLRRAD